MCVNPINHEGNLPKCNIGSWQNCARNVRVIRHLVPYNCTRVFTYIVHPLYIAIFVSCVTGVLIPCESKRVGVDLIKED